LFSGSPEGSTQFSDILQLFETIDERHDARCAYLANDWDREVHEFAFERRLRERAFRVAFGDFYGLAQRLTVCEDNFYACATAWR
jgi:hypothetical protein